MSIIETVKVIAKNKQGYIIINKEDFRQSTHERFVERSEEIEKVEKIEEIVTEYNPAKEKKPSRKKRGTK